MVVIALYSILLGSGLIYSNFLKKIKKEEVYSSSSSHSSELAPAKNNSKKAVTKAQIKSQIYIISPP